MSLLARCLVVLAVAGCSSKPAEPKPGAGAAPAPSGEGYFSFTVDGKAFSIAADDVSSTFRTVGDHAEFKIFAGAQGATGVSLIAIGPMTGPSSTPSGAPLAASGIAQGSVSLHEYPDKGYTTNSFNAIYPEMAVVVPDAVVITSIVADGKDAKLVTGTFAAKTFGSHSKGTPDPKDTDHVVGGKFRIRHEFTSMSGDRF